MSDAAIAEETVLDHLARSIRDRNHHFALDTNIIFILARENKWQLLNRLPTCPGYVVCLSNIIEVRGLLAARDITDEARKIMERFLRNNANRHVRVDIEPFVERLTGLSVLLPRSLVDFVMIESDDSIVRRLLKFYRNLQDKGVRFMFDDLQLKAKQEFDYYPEEIRPALRKRFDRLCGELDIDRSRLDLPEYNRLVEVDLQRLTEELRKIINNAKMQEIINGLERLRKKNHERDIMFVAETIKKKCVAESLDQDVKFLGRLDVARRIHT